MRRYTYKRMSAQELSKALDQVGLTMRQFSRTTGANEGTVEKWLQGVLDVPHWVPVLLSLLTLPAAKAMALRVTEHYLEGENDGSD